MKYCLILVSVIIFTSTVCAQTMAVKGKLTAYNSFPVMNVEISSKKAKATTMSDSLGYFSIVCLEKDVVQIEPKGFQPENINVNNETDFLKINLIFIDTKKNRELAINSGYLTEIDLNYATANLAEENIDYCKYTNMHSLLRATLGPSISVSNSGVITHRDGITSFSGMSPPLIIVDGQKETSIDWIRPCIVRSIKVLKGSDARIYGTRGDNDVVVITTKQ
ncbi:MAG: hypothetical protein K9J30_02770 [Bacteroidales bacterium]|nr:hypothetical protein [Bacteroidales bacterium]